MKNILLIFAATVGLGLAQNPPAVKSVPDTRTVNGKRLNADISILPADVGVSGTNTGDTTADIATKLGYSPTAAVNSMSWVARIDANAQATGTVTTIASGGSAGTFSPTGTPAIAASQFGSRKGITLNGSNQALVATTGGLAMQNGFYLGMVLKSTNNSGYKNLITFGNTATDQRRSMVISDGTVGFVGSNTSGNVGGNTMSSPSIGSATAYLDVIYQNGELRTFINGVEYKGVRPVFVTYSSDTIRIGTNVAANGEWFAGSIGEIFMKASVTSGELAAIRSYAASTYSITVATGSSVVPVPNITDSATPTVSRTSIGSDGNGNIVIGDGAAYKTGGPITEAYPFSLDAKLSVKGSLVAWTRGTEHLFISEAKGLNPVAIWNTSETGYSAARFLHWATGIEMGAMGYSPIPTGPFGYGSGRGGMYIESSNFVDTNQYGQLNFVQSKRATDSLALRYSMDAATGDNIWYSRANFTNGAAQTALTQMTLQESTGNLTLTTGQLIVSTQKTPSSATDTGVKGTVCHDTNYIYVCTATNTWKRVAISTW